jgi:hypothetical protein
VGLALGSFAVLALVWITASLVAARRSDRGAPWSSDPGRIEEKIVGTVTIVTLGKQWEFEGQGSGFLVDPSGVGVTNVHVLEEATHAYAILGDGRAYDILRVKAWDEDQDLVVFRLGRDLGDGPEWPRGLATLKLSESKAPEVGDWVATLTSPKGLSNTLTDGLVSAYREENGSRYIQTTAPISPGSSGGPLFDRRGHVVGVAVSQMSDGQNLNFAVPVDSLRPLLAGLGDMSFETFLEQAFEAHWAFTGLDRELADLARVCIGMMEEEDYEPALRGFLDLARRRPEAPFPYLMAARCCRGLEDEARAVRYYRHYLEHAYPGDPTRVQVEGWLRQRDHAAAPA